MPLEGAVIATLAELLTGGLLRRLAQNSSTAVCVDCPRLERPRSSQGSEPLKSGADAPGAAERAVRFHRIAPVCRHFRSALLTTGTRKFSGNSSLRNRSAARVRAADTKDCGRGKNQALRPKGALATGPRRCMSGQGPRSYCLSPLLSTTDVTCAVDFPKARMDARSGVGQKRPAVTRHRTLGKTKVASRTQALVCS